ncbi:MAG: cytochrome c biogenesis protein CcsA, partial [Spirochaetota bacterium]|nr:cytochrome c biogenesis protein CcsA [Spirochaetota bacterium]
VIRSNEENKDIHLAVITITQVFIFLMLVVHGPFEYIWDVRPMSFRPGVIPADGSGLNPLLQNPWMVIHPPVLFVGYASASIPFAYVIAGLIRNDYKTWVSAAYKWVLICMTSLGIGIFLGGYWAYVVLGWGGYWGWDPVENSSLIPWLLIVALFHGLIIQKRKNALIKTNLFLTIISLVLVFYSTFLTRSGILSDFSVHSFSDLGLSGYLIFIILAFFLGGMILLLYRFNDIKSSPLSKNIISFNNLISYGVITLCFYSLFILIGTSMPIISKIFLENPTSVSIKFYNNISIPLGILILFFIGIATIYQFLKKINKMNIILILVLSVVLSIFFNIYYTKDIFSYIFCFLGFFLILQNVLDIVKYKKSFIIASRLSHIGIAFLVIGVIASNSHSYSFKKKLFQGMEETIESLNITFTGLMRSEKSNLRFKMKQGDESYDIETAYYIDNKTRSLYREPYIMYGFSRDIYLSPVDYRSGAQEVGKLEITKGEEKKIDGMRIRFIGFKVDKKKMMSGNPTIFARLNITLKGRNYTVTPGIIIKGKNKREQIDAKIANSGRRISLLQMDIRHKKIQLFIEPDKKGKNVFAMPDSAIIEVSFKRLIWLVWLGTILISVGSSYAIRRSMKIVKND